MSDQSTAKTQNLKAGSSISSWPKISIITPSLNQAEYLERTIQSVLEQGYPNLEYIIIDGESTDGSVEIIEKYQRHLKYWVSEKDKNHSEALNKGFAAATGEISAWLNSDDTYLPGTLSTIAQEFQRDYKADIVFGNTMFINEADQVIGDLKLTKFNLNSYIYKAFGVHQPATFWRTKVLQELGGIDESIIFCMDTDLFLRMARAKKRFVFINQYLACFRRTSQQKTAVMKHVQQKERPQIVKNLFDINIDYHSFKNKCISQVYQIRRFFLYARQGDWAYIFKLIKNRLRGKKDIIGYD